MAIKVYSPTDFEDTSSGVSIDGNLVVDTSVLYIDTANDRVGIGTTNPLYPLTVESSTSGLVSRIYNTNTDGQGLLIRAGSTSSATRVLQLASSNDTKIMTVNSNGNVGIGTNNPAYRLDVQDATIGMIRAYGSSIGRLSLQNSTRHYSTSVQGSNWLFYDESGGAERMRITSSGNVLIGTTTDSGFKLNVSGSSHLNGETVLGNFTASDSDEWPKVYWYRDTDNDWDEGLIKASSSRGFFGKTHYGIHFDNARAFGFFTSSWTKVFGLKPDQVRSEVDLVVDGVITATGGNSTNWNTAYGWGDHASAGYLTSYTETQTLDDVTTLGDTTTNAITVGGLTVNASDATIGNSSQQTTELNIIATNTAGAPAWTTAISMQGYEGRGQGIFFTDTSNASEEWFAGINYGNNWDTYSIGYDASGGQAEYTANAILTVKNNGNVGIGTYNPSKKLDVQGGYFVISDGGSNQVAFVQGGNGYAYFGNLGDGKAAFGNSENYTTLVADGGNVGIGTTSPSQKLHVAGSALINGTIYSGDGSISTSNSLQLQYNAISGDGVIASKSTGGSTTLALQTANSGTTATKLYITSTGNVGIGTTSPSYKLDIKGASANIGDGDQIFSVGNTTGGTQLAFGSSENSYNWIRSYESGAGGRDFVLAANAEIMRLTAAGTVGIGTSSPGAKLQINGATADGTASALIVRNSSLTGLFSVRNDGRVDIAAGALVQSGGGYANTSSNSSYFTGNVGIGTSSPAQKLEVVGTIQATSTGTATLILRGDSNNSDDTGQLDSTIKMLHDDGNHGILLETRNYVSAQSFEIKSLAAGTETSRFLIDTDGTLKIPAYGAGFLITDANGDVSLDTSTYLTSYTETDTLASVTSRGATTSNTIEFTGAANAYVGIQGETDVNLKIGTGAGSEPRIYLFGSANGQSNAGDVFIGTADNTGVVDINGNVDISGDVGIGTSSPDHSLQIERSTGDHLKLSRSGVGSFELGVVSSNALKFSDGGAERMRIASNGNVGIGTASPSEKLHVSGNARIEGDLTVNGSYTQIDTDVNTTEQWNVTNDGTGPAVTINQTGAQDIMDVQDDGTSVFYIEDGGNVGIGYTSPTAKLSVSGAILAGGKYSYRKGYGSLDTTGAAVAGLSSASNGASAMFKFEMNGGLGHYQKVVYSCYNAGGNWFANKVIDEGTNELDVEASANNNTTITFTFKARNSTQYYSPAVEIEASGTAINTTYL